MPRRAAAAALVDRGVALELLDPPEARALLDSIDVPTHAGLRDRALIVYSFARRDEVSLDEGERIANTRAVLNG